MKLTLKGKRKYITGADIINLFKNKLIHEKNIVFNFHKLTSNHLILKKNSKKDYKKSDLICVITTSSKNKYIILEKKNKVSQRKDYDEKKLLANHNLKINSITGKNNKFNFFDNIVALNKKLLNELIGKYKWVFCKLEIKRLNNLNFNQIKIELIDNSKNFYISKIIIEKKFIGKIYFYKK